MNAEAVILCEVLELSVRAMAALGPYRRTKVFKEAQQNIKKWPMLNDMQRVQVNNELVGLQYHKADAKREGGKYIPMFIEIDGSPAAVHYEWVFAEEDSGDEIPSGTKTHRLLAPELDIPPDSIGNSLSHRHTEVLPGTIYHSQALERSHKRESGRDALHGGNLAHVNSHQGGEPQTYPYFLPQNQIMFFPAPFGHGYNFENCKMVVNGVDASRVTALVNHDEDVKQGRDGTALGDWEMELEFSAGFLESNAFDEWKAIADEQRKRIRPIYFDEGSGPGSA